MSASRPRHYARAYLDAESKGRDAQRNALKGLPVQWRELTERHIRIEQEKLKWLKQ